MTNSESESKSLFSKFKSAIRESPEVEIRKRTRAKEVVMDHSAKNSLNFPPLDVDIASQSLDDLEDSFEAIRTDSSRASSTAKFLTNDKSDIISFVYGSDSLKQEVPDDDEDMDIDEESQCLHPGKRSQKGSIRSTRSLKVAFDVFGMEPSPSPSLDEGSREPISKEMEPDVETCWSALRELIFPFILAGMGNIAASYWLGKVQSWSVFKNIPQLVILVPPLLGLKGNVEMTLASRLSTHANLGDFDSRSAKWKIIFGNMVLLQCQVSIVGFIAPLIALGLSFTSEDVRVLYWKEIILLVASSVITANLANLILGTLMCAVVLFSRRWGINPDNIATPIAASLGDVTTMILLATISRFLYTILDSNPWVQNTLLAFLMSLIPIWACLARRNPFTKSIIVSGWYPLFGAMLIQNAGGLVMERALKTFHRIANLQLLINGVGGNLVAIQSSRMSTYLHKHVLPRQLPNSDPVSCTVPGASFFSDTSVHTKMARILLALAIPSHFLFLLVTEAVNQTYFMTAPFVTIYLAVGIIHVAVLLQLAYNFVHWLWKMGVDPDSSAIPFLTSFADFIGSVLLATAFIFLTAMGDKNAIEPQNSLTGAQNTVQYH